MCSPTGFGFSLVAEVDAEATRFRFAGTQTSCRIACPNLPRWPPTLSQPLEVVGDTKSHSKTTVSPTSHRGPNLLLHIHVGERKRSGTCFSIRKEKDPRWGHRGWDHIRSSHWRKMIKGCPNPLEGWDHAVGGWDRNGQRVDLRRPRRPWSFSLWPRTAGCYIWW